MVKKQHCCGPATKVCGTVTVKPDPNEPLRVTSVDDDCVAVRNKPGSALEVSVTGPVDARVSGTVSVTGPVDARVSGTVSVTGPVDARVSGTVSVEGPVEVTGQVDANVSGTVSVADGCVAVKNKTGETLTVDGCVFVQNDECCPLAVEGCVNVSNCGCDPLFIDGKVTVEGPVKVEDPVTVEGAVEVTNEKLNVNVCNDLLCAVTENNLHNGVLKHLSGSTGSEDNDTASLEIVVDTALLNEDFAGDAFYPKTLSLAMTSQNSLAAVLSDSYTAVVDVDTGAGFEQVLDLGRLLLNAPGDFKLINETGFYQTRWSIDLEKVFGSVKLDGSLFPLPNGSRVRVSIDYTDPVNESYTLSVGLSGHVRCPQKKSCDFSCPSPVCRDGETTVCNDVPVGQDLSELVVNEEEVGELTYCWEATSVPQEVTDASVGLQTTQVIDDQLVNLSTVPQEVVYTFTVKSKDGLCSSKPCEVTVTVLPELLVDVTGPESKCCGEVVRVEATGVTGGAGEPYSYSWTVDSEPAGVDSPVLEVVFDCEGGTGLHDIRVVVEDSQGCTGGAELRVQIWERPECDARIELYCVNGEGEFVNAELSANATGGTPPYEYLWSPSGETAANITVTETGAYEVLVTDQNGCTCSSEVVVDECPEEQEPMLEIV